MLRKQKQIFTHFLLLFSHGMGKKGPARIYAWAEALSQPKRKVFCFKVSIVLPFFLEVLYLKMLLIFCMWQFYIMLFDYEKKGYTNDEHFH